MKITRVTPLVLGSSWRNLTIVKVETDEGLTGLGEVRMLNHTDALLGYLSEAVPNHVRGSDPFDVEDLVQRMYRNDYARAGEVNMCAIAAIEVACWDIVGQALGQPIWRLLGGKVRDRIPAYANGWYTVERTPEEFHAAAKRAVAKGYRALKFDPFGAGFYELDAAERRRVVALVEAVRDAVGPDVELLLEMHGRFNPPTAIAMVRELARFGLGWAEEPVPPENLAALEKVAAAVAPLGVPIATGERIHTRYDFRELFARQAADVIQPDPTHFGGLWETRKLAATAETHYVLIAPHNTGGSISTMAMLHLAAATPNFKIQEYFNDFADPWVKESVDGMLEVDPTDGCFPLPDRPGLGVTLREDVVAAHPRQRVFFNLFEENWHRRQAVREE
ncbi:MAG: mandelate racemase/muconate lactonizing enzyme family protein, partial [Thermomicrobiaceae bacterium]|nr:mandelate racemase/muconate lactonizing enzyme family protein [Thermomicrobiaceae bacterium]